MFSDGVGTGSGSAESLLQLINNMAVRIVKMVLIMVFVFGLGFDQKYVK
jgi:Tfp pilus assembly protein PilO